MNPATGEGLITFHAIKFRGGVRKERKEKEREKEKCNGSQKYEEQCGFCLDLKVKQFFVLL